MNEHSKPTDAPRRSSGGNPITSLQLRQALDVEKRSSGWKPANPTAREIKVFLAHSAGTDVRRMLQEHRGGAPEDLPRDDATANRTDRAPLSGLSEQVRFRIAALAIRVFGNETKALDWMSKPNARLDGQTPLDCIETEGGYARVEEKLHAIDHGVW